MSLSSRPSTSTDYEFARQTHHRAYREVVVRQFGSWDEERQNQYFDNTWRDGAFEILIVRGMPCGYAGWEVKSDGIWINELVLLPEYQGQGLGTQYLRSILRVAEEKGVQCRLQVLKENRAWRLYERLRFREVSANVTHFVLEWRLDNKL